MLENILGFFACVAGQFGELRENTSWLFPCKQKTVPQIKTSIMLYRWWLMMVIVIVKSSTGWLRMVDYAWIILNDWLLMVDYGYTIIKYHAWLEYGWPILFGQNTLPRWWFGVSLNSLPLMPWHSKPLSPGLMYSGTRYTFTIVDVVSSMTNHH